MAAAWQWCGSGTAAKPHCLQDPSYNTNTNAKLKCDTDGGGVANNPVSQRLFFEYVSRQVESQVESKRLEIE